MKNYISLLFLAFTILACKNTPTEQPDTTEVFKDTIDYKSNNTSDSLIGKKDVYHVLDSLMRQLYGDEFVKKDLLKGEQQTDYINLFSLEKVVKLIAYEHKKHESKKKVRYVDMDFIVLAYNSKEDALVEFVKLKKYATSVLSQSARGSMNNEEQYVILDGVDPKSGSFIFLTGKTIINLVKRCAGNPLKVNWDEYEAKMLGDLYQEDRAYIDVIKSNCGDATFKVVKYNR